MTPPVQSQTLVQQAREYYARGDRNTAYSLLSQAIRINPNDVLAWLWMSAVVSDIDKQRYCLERVLALDPTNRAARRGLDMLQVRQTTEAVQAEQAQPNHPPASERQAGKLGDYLVERGIITRRELEMALDEQRLYWQKWQGVRPPLGDILISHGMITPETLASALADQQFDRLYGRSRETPKYIGEYLVERGIITSEQFKAVLEKQTRMRQRGTNILIGELLVSAGYVTPDIMTRILSEQQDTLLNEFGFGNDDE